MTGPPARRFADPRRFIAHNLVAAAGTLGAGALGLLLQAFVSHHFRPLVFGAVFSVFSFYILLTQPSSAVARLVAWSTSRELAATPGASPDSNAMLRVVNRTLLTVGAAVGLLCIVAAPAIAGFLRVSPVPVVIGALGVPFMLSTDPLIGALQGEQRWLGWSALNIAVAAVRLVSVAAFTYVLGPTGVLVGVSVAAVVTYAACLVGVRRRLRHSQGTIVWGPVWRFLVLSCASSVLVATAMGSDVILVEHFFHGSASGQFSAVALVSRSLFFAVMSIAAVLLPKVAKRHALSMPTIWLVTASVGAAVAVGLVGFVAFSLGGHLILRSFSGRAYTQGADYVALYALGMPLLAAASIVSNAQQSLADLRFLWVLVPCILLKPVLILLFHSSLLTVALVSDIAIALTLLATATQYVVSERSRWPSRQRTSAGLVASLRALLGARRASNPPPLTGRRTSPARLREREVWLRRTSWVVDQPRRVVAILGVMGLCLRHSWLTTQPLSSGDWGWQASARTNTYFPWSTIWDPTRGLGGEVGFASAFRFPVRALLGALSRLGLDWAILEKLVFFIPIAVGLPVAGWLLAREVMGRTRWTLIAPLLLVASTYFLLDGDSEPPLALAEILTLLVVVAYLRCLRTHSPRWAIAGALGLALAASYDIRPVYLAVLAMALYLAIHCAAHRTWRVARAGAGLTVLMLGLFVATQAFWVLPLLTFRGNASLPVPQAPDFNLLTLDHGVAGVSAFWTGGTPAPLVEAPLNPVYLLFPLIAFLTLLSRRISAPVLWLCMLALLGAFFSKTDNAPFGGVYDWLYVHVPGWQLFREGSKFLYLVGAAYAVLIPCAVRSFVAWMHDRRWFFRRAGARLAAATALCLVVPVTSSLMALESGALAATTTATAEPTSFAAVASILGHDRRPGSVLWFGGSVYRSGLRSHTFGVASASHPAVSLTGNVNAAHVNERDPFQEYCADDLVPFCYTSKPLLRYLLPVSGAAYVIVPAGSNVGSLPPGVTRAWLAGQLTAVLGRPSIAGGGNTELLVWRVAAVAPPVSAASDVAMVEGGSWNTASVLPALQALDLPVVFRQTFNHALWPATTAPVPDSVPVLPRVDGGCQALDPGTVALLAMSTAASVEIAVADRLQSAPRLAVSPREPGWAFYGPLTVRRGVTPVSTSAGTTLGPCVGWSARAAVLAGGARRTELPQAAVSYETVSVATAPTGAGPWFELRRAYSSGWRLDGRRPSAVGDGYFSLFHVPRPIPLHFAFATVPWEAAGLAVSLAFVALALVAVLLLGRLRRAAVAARPAPAFQLPGAARGTVAAGLALLAAGTVAEALAWTGVPSVAPWTALASDPYDLPVGYCAAAVAFVAIATIAALTTKRQGGGSTRRPVRAPRSVGLAAVAGLVLAGCGSTVSDLANLLTQAQRDGTLSPSVVGSTLDDARIQRAVANPKGCIADYTQLLRDASGFTSAFAGRASCYVNGRTNAAAAIHDYDQALRLGGDPGALLLGRAAAERASGSPAAAAADYMRVTGEPASTPLEELLAIDGLLALDQEGAAEAAYARAAGRSPASSTLDLADADIALATGRDGAAHMTAAIRDATSSAQLASALAYECHQQVLTLQYQAAVTTCRRAAVLAPGGAAPFDDLSAAELGLDSPAEALQAIDASIGAALGNAGPYAQAAGVDGFGLATLYVARGWIELELNNPGTAVDDFRNALRALPNAAPDLRARIKADEATARSARPTGP